MKLAETYPLRLFCRLLGVPRSTIYYQRAPAPDVDAMHKADLLSVARSLHPASVGRLHRLPESK